jgi:3-oxoacyl-[acyl-carrier-protein] synthase-1
MTAYLNALGLACALGQGRDDVARRLLAGDTSGMQAQGGWIDSLDVTVGAVAGALPELGAVGPDKTMRNNRLLLAAAEQIAADVHQALARFGATRIGVVLGTSTTGIHEATDGIASYLRNGQMPPGYHYAQQELAAPAVFLAEHFGLGGPVYSISTACTSSARALLSARRLLAAGLCDAVLCGGVDTLCRLTLNGFHALEAISAERCNPFSSNRHGINIGEASALFLMTREPGDDDSIALLGGAANSDAHHISAPDPQGCGAIRVMRDALADAGLQAAQIDYLNLHGTATRHNDAMESLAVTEVFPAGVACSSTKPLTGHTLGAAGALEAAFCWLALSAHNPQRRLPPHRWDGQADAQLPRLALTSEAASFGEGTRRMMSNSFAFGGSNVSLILGHGEVLA